MADLAEYKLADGIVYGPIRSRRLGLSLGVNLLPVSVKVCSFNCSYCQCGWTYDTVDHAALKKHEWPTPERVQAALDSDLKGRKEPVDSITLAGNGEPTLHARFAECVRAVLRARDRRMPKARVDILTNGAHLDRDDVIAGMNLLDERIVKLDAGDESTFMDMNTPVTPVSLEEIVAGIARLKDVVVQSMFTRGRVDNTTDAAVGAYVTLLGRLRPRPKQVQIYGISRFPADPRLHPVERDALDAIAARVASAGLRADVF